MFTQSGIGRSTSPLMTLTGTVSYWTAVRLDVSVCLPSCSSYAEQIRSQTLHLESANGVREKQASRSRFPPVNWQLGHCIWHRGLLTHNNNNKLS